MVDLLMTLNTIRWVLQLGKSQVHSNRVKRTAIRSPSISSGTPTISGSVDGKIYVGNPTVLSKNEKFPTKMFSISGSSFGEQAAAARRLWRTLPSSESGNCGLTGAALCDNPKRLGRNQVVHVFGVWNTYYKLSHVPKTCMTSIRNTKSGNIHILWFLLYPYSSMLIERERARKWRKLSLWPPLLNSALLHGLMVFRIGWNYQTTSAKFHRIPAFICQNWPCEGHQNGQKPRWPKHQQ